MSASVDFYVPEFGRQLGFDLVISHRRALGRRPARGHADHSNRRGEEKARCLRELMADARGHRKRSRTATADSDLPHLRLVRHGVLVNGSLGARRAAAELGVSCVEWIVTAARASVTRITFIAVVARTPRPPLTGAPPTSITQRFPRAHLRCGSESSGLHKMPEKRGKIQAQQRAACARHSQRSASHLPACVRDSAAQRAALQPRGRSFAAGGQCDRAGHRRLHVVRHRRRPQPLRRLRIPPDAPRSRRPAVTAQPWISSLVASEDGLWIRPMAAAWCSAARRPANSKRPRALRDAPDLQRVRALARDRLGRLWIATRDAGVAIYDPRSQELRRITHPAEIRSRSPTIPSSASCICAAATR